MKNEAYLYECAGERAIFSRKCEWFVADTLGGPRCDCDGVKFIATVDYDELNEYQQFHLNKRGWAPEKMDEF
jgi:hypothetical protein